MIELLKLWIVSLLNTSKIDSQLTKVLAIPPTSDGNFAKTGYLYRNQNPIYKHLSMKENINLF